MPTADNSAHGIVCKNADVEHAGDGRGARSDGIAITCAEQAHESFGDSGERPDGKASASTGSTQSACNNGVLFERTGRITTRAEVA